MTTKAQLILIARFFWLIPVVLFTGCDAGPPAELAADGTTKQGQYAGTAACASCHATETGQWQGSHHDLAIQIATSANALGDFADSNFEHNGVTSRFFTEGEELFVETDGANGDLEIFPVRYTFGVFPLQQYLLEMEDGKIQALSIAWDSRRTDAGGQRWFHVYGDDQIDHSDVLHWTQPSQNWETMCADCHSTNLTSTYSIDTDRFATTWSDLNVGCEACHGPAAGHVTWARDPDTAISNKGLEIIFDENAGVNWLLDPETGNSARTSVRTTNKELNSCAGCHSRRSRIAEGNHPATPFLDTYQPALIEPPLYHPDGQILDEVYVYGSFLQSKMHAAGVSCSDCHDPHSLELRAPAEQVCLQCHAAEKFASIDHQLHEPGITNCIDCHMPAETYMQIDVRNDHSFRIPRPDLSMAYGTPNACNSCHTDQDAAWALQALNQADRRINSNHWSAALAGASGNNAALAGLAVDTTTPAIIRATAAAQLNLADNASQTQLLNELAASADPLVRLGTASSLDNSQPELITEQALQLLQDNVLAVRLASLSTLLRTDPVMLPAGSRTLINRAIDEYKQAMLVNAERPEAHISIGNMERLQGRLDSAETNYRTAIRLGPKFVPGYVNLADLYREWGREPEAEQTLREGLVIQPQQSYLHHALGLALIRQDRMDEALEELRLAADLPGATAQFAFVYALALDTTNQTDAALNYLQTAMVRFENDPQLAAYYEELKRKASR